MLNTATSYDNPFYHENVYGHALELLTRNRAKASSGAEISIHLDIGCGYGRIAEPLEKALGVKYIGVDLEATGLESLRSRGFETQVLDLAAADALPSALARIIAGRNVASISMLDTLEHLSNGDEVLTCLHNVASQFGALVILSVPNVTHRDIGFKLAFGDFDYTVDGLLDYTHVRLFSAPFLERVVRHAGLHRIDEQNVRRTYSDQFFPSTHPALAQSTSLHRLLKALRERSEPHDDVNQFVWACVAGPEISTVPFVEETAPRRPFLSIVTRTQGKRLQSLVEAFTCLAGQSNIDFEVLVVGHRLSFDRQKAVERVLEDNPEWLRERTRLILVDKGNRTHPLNVGFEAALGDYISILDDDDTPMAHWVETFKTLASDNPGRLLRASVVRQDVVKVDIGRRDGVRAVGPMETMYPSSFDFLDHLRQNNTPPISVAFPRGAFHNFKIHFDEALTTTEDWDYIMRVATVTDVACSSAITSIYHWWTNEHSSRTDHPTHEWVVNHQRIFQKMDEDLVLFPKGTPYTIRKLLDERDRLARECDGLRSESDLLRNQNDRLRIECEEFRTRIDQSQAEVQEAARLRSESRDWAKRLQLMELLSSTSWWVSSPLRLFGRVRGRPIARSSCKEMHGAQLDEAIQRVYRSRSWSLTKPIRGLVFWRD
jgi:SAM-dependent methyltransferase